MPKQMRLGNVILIDFCPLWEPSWPSQTEPRRSKIDVEMVSKFDQFLKASWNAIFSAQEAPRRASAADRRSGWSRPEAAGGEFRRGKTRTSEKKNLEERTGRIRRPRIPVSHADPVGRRIEDPLGGYRRRSFLILAALRLGKKFGRITW